MVGTLQPGCPDGYDRADMTASLPGELFEVFERPVTADLVTIDDPMLGGWTKVQKRHFDDGGIFDEFFLRR